MNRHRLARPAFALSLASAVAGCQSCPDCPPATWDCVDSVQYVDSNPRSFSLQASGRDGVIRPNQPAGGLSLVPAATGNGMEADVRWSIRKIVDREARKSVTHHVREFNGGESSTSEQVVSPVQVGLAVESSPSKESPVVIEWRLCKFERVSDPVAWPVKDPMQVAAGRAEITDASQKIVLGCEDLVGLQGLNADAYRFVVRASVAGLSNPQLYCSSPVMGTSIPKIDADLRYTWDSRADSKATARSKSTLVVGGQEYRLDSRDRSPAFDWQRSASGGVAFDLGFRVDRTVDRAVTWTCERSGTACGKPTQPKKYVRTFSPDSSPEDLQKWVVQDGLPMPAAPMAYGRGIGERVRLAASPLKVTWQLNRGEGRDVLLVKGHVDTIASGEFVVDPDSEQAERTITVGSDALSKLAPADEAVLVVRVAAADERLADSPAPFQVTSKPIRGSALSAGGARAAAQ